MKKRPQNTHRNLRLTRETLRTVVAGMSKGEVTTGGGPTYTCNCGSSACSV